MHISVDVQRITLNASCVTISVERTEQLDIFCRVTGFMSDFLSFIDVELIWFFHGALQLLNTDTLNGAGKNLGFLPMKFKKHSERCRHCALAVVRQSQKFRPAQTPSPGHRTAKFYSWR